MIGRLKRGIEAMMRRRSLLAGAAATLSACAPTPGRAGDVLAAGQPAALLIWALAPERLAGWPRRPSPASAALLGNGAERLAEIGALTSGGAPAALETLAALRPRLVLDYGDTGDEHAALARRLEGRLGAPWRSLDGALTRTPEALRQAGDLLGAADRGAALAEMAADVLDRWRAAPPGPAFYYARGRDGLETAFRGALATEVLEGAGWTNLAVGGRDVGRVGREQIAAWDPEAIVTLDADFARTAAADPLWRRRRDGSLRRILRMPDLPFGWIDRPPSINRLLGCAWLAGAGPTETAALSARLFGGQGSTLSPRWIS